MSMSISEWAPPLQPQESSNDALNARHRELAADPDRALDYMTLGSSDVNEISVAPEAAAASPITVELTPEQAELAEQVMVVGRGVNVMRRAVGEEGAADYQPAYLDTGWEVVATDGLVQRKSGEVEPYATVQKIVGDEVYTKKVPRSDLLAVNASETLAEPEHRISLEEAQEIGEEVLEVADVEVGEEVDGNAGTYDIQALKEAAGRVQSIPPPMTMDELRKVMGAEPLPLKEPTIPNLEAMMASSPEEHSRALLARAEAAMDDLQRGNEEEGRKALSTEEITALWRLATAREGKDVAGNDYYVQDTNYALSRMPASIRSNFDLHREYKQRFDAIRQLRDEVASYENK